MNKNSTIILKEANKHLVLDCIKSYEPITQEGILNKTNLSRPTVMNSLKNLIADGIVVKAGYAESKGGRMPLLYSLNANAFFALGIDFEFPSVRLAVSDIKGNIIFRSKFKYSLDTPSSQTLDLLYKEINSLIKESKVVKDRVAGIGIGVPGVVDAQNGASTNIERIKKWNNINIKLFLESKFNIPVFVKNDVYLIGLVEKKLYLKDKMESFIYIGIRAGIGAAIFIKNNLYEGLHGNAGFAGHMTIDADGPECICGRYGCLEAFAGEIAIIKKYLQVKESKNEMGKLDAENLTLGIIVQNAKDNDTDAIAVLNEASYYLGIGIANIIKLFEIPNIIISGYPGIEETDFLKNVKKIAAKNIPGNTEKLLSIEWGQTSEDLYPLGGCYLVLEHIFNKPELNLFV